MDPSNPQRKWYVWNLTGADVSDLTQKEIPSHMSKNRLTEYRRSTLDLNIAEVWQVKQVGRKWMSLQNILIEEFNWPDRKRRSSFFFTWKRIFFPSPQRVARRKELSNMIPMVSTHILRHAVFSSDKEHRGENMHTIATPGGWRWETNTWEISISSRGPLTNHQIWVGWSSVQISCFKQNLTYMKIMQALLNAKRCQWKGWSNITRLTCLS